MEWFKNLINGVNKDDQASFTSGFGAAVMLDLAPLGKINPILLKDAVRYVLKGEPEEVLLKIRNNNYGEALGLLCCIRNYSKEKPRAIFHNIDPEKAVCYMRLLRVYEAAAASSNNWVVPVTGVSRWVDIFIQEATGLRQYLWGESQKFDPTITIAFVERMMETAGEPTDMMVRAAFLLDSSIYSSATIIKTITSLTGFYTALTRHAKVVLEALNHSEHRQRVQALNILYHDSFDLTPFREKIASSACSSAKTVREAAQKIIIRKPLVFNDCILQILREGDNQERLYAVSLYAQLNPNIAPEILKERLAIENAPKVKATIEKVLNELAGQVEVGSIPQSNLLDELDIKIPPVTEFSSSVPLPNEIKHDFISMVRNYNESAKVYNEIHQKEKYFSKMYLISEKTISEAFDLLQNMVVKKETNSLWNVHLYRDNKLFKELQLFITKPQINLVHVLRLLIIIDELRWIKNYDFHLGGYGEQLLQHYFQSHNQLYDIRVIAAAGRAIGIEPQSFGWNCLNSYSWGRQIVRKPQDFWMYFAENQNILEEVLGFRPRTHEKQVYWEKEERKAAFYILTAFPQIPLIFQPKLWELALEGPKTERPLAQICLSKVPGREKRIIEALKDGRQEVRAEAAKWLEQIECKAAIPDLKQTLSKEKSDIAKGALMETLESLGVPVDEFLGRGTLKQEAEKTLSKGIPSQLKWFPFDVLPSVRWQNGEKIDPVIIKWFVVLGFKLGLPEPVPAIRKYCQFMNPSDRRELGSYVLQAWLTQDTLPKYTMETAAVAARTQVKQWIKSYPQYYKPESEEELYRNLLSSYLNECLGSAIKEKGILAIPSACCGAEVVPLVESYLKKWYGHRVHQCRALVQMLSWNEHPLAIQLLLSVANRFRTKGIQEQATQCVNELAERQGWTLDELADRTIPTAGFDEKSELTLDFGPRKFICRLNDDLEIGIYNEDGKPVKNLPAAGKNDNPELAKGAKKELSEAKKIIKQGLRLQVERLYENMCTQRSWRFGDLRMFLFEHPLLSRYCQRLVWVKIEDGQTVETFRLMEDRTLTDYEDRAVCVDDEALIRLAHACNVSAEVAAAWMQHFADYEVKPLFEQFGKPVYTLKETERKIDEIVEYLGYIMDNFKLRGLAVKLGYTRGQAEDGGFFYLYKKRFSGLKVEAVIEFSGVPLPEENVKVALKTLYFNQIIEGETDYYAPDCRVGLEELPPVLLSETWNDLRRIAEASDGYDPDWEKKVEY